MDPLESKKAPGGNGDRVAPGADVEKAGDHVVNTNVMDDSATCYPKPVDGNASDSDGFQGGVRQVRAVTTIWSKKTLFSMFAL